MIINEEGPELGETRRFIPAAYLSAMGLPTESMLPRPTNPVVTGTIVQVHREHRWYRVAYETGHGTLYECFKF